MSYRVGDGEAVMFSVFKLLFSFVLFIDYIVLHKTTDVFVSYLQVLTILTVNYCDSSHRAWATPGQPAPL